ncbi:protein IMPACT-A isoform X2 [Anabrus simplex]|uniref:protein IMPACT-A isoform X2 n=1 Tax=Anabrus simplex TaxID=316456 RepID=UPI0034DCEDE9
MTDEDNMSRQAEEIEALCSIYGNEWNIDSESSYSIQIKEGCHSVTLYIDLPADYPSNSPPMYQLLAPELRNEIKQKIASSLDDVYFENVGETVLYQWIEKVREVLQELSEQPSNEEEAVDTGDNTCVDSNIPMSDYELPQIHHGDVITDRKSVFQGHAASVVTTDQVKQILLKLYENKKIAHATHNIYAYRIFKEDTQSYIQDCEDDGEHQAGGRVLHLLQPGPVQAAGSKEMFGKDSIVYARTFQADLQWVPWIVSLTTSELDCT